MELAELLELKKTDPKAFEEKLKKHRDLKNALDSHWQLGYEEGMVEGLKRSKEKGVENVAIGSFKEGINIKIISKVTGLSEDELLKLFRREGLI